MAVDAVVDCEDWNPELLWGGGVLHVIESRLKLPSQLLEVWPEVCTSSEEHWKN